MALKPDRNEFQTDVSFFMNRVAERGIIVVSNTVGSGAAMDQAKALVDTPSGAGFTGTVSGSYPVGLLINDMVSIDLTRQHYNWHKDEGPLGGKVCLLKIGFVVTNQITGTPVGNEPAYFDTAGKLTPTDPSSGAQWGNTVRVGSFASKKDADGYCKVNINIR